MLLVQGQCGQDQRPLDGTLTVTHHYDSFPPTTWPVCGSHFKALVHLIPGPNELRFDFSSPKLALNNFSNSLHTKVFRINYLPLVHSPPLHLAILIGKDSPGTFDSSPEKAQKEGNDLSSAIRKYRMAANLWQAFASESMYRNGFGRRCFRLEEEYQQGTLSKRDMETMQMRNEAKIHVVRSNKTVSEIRDLGVKKEYESSNRLNDLFGFAMDEMRWYFGPQHGQTYHVAVLLLDNHWVFKTETITGNIKLSGGDESLRIALSGSHALHSYPTCIEDIIPAFTDCSKRESMHRSSTAYGDSDVSWQAASSGKCFLFDQRTEAI